jgi:hypothetical protein
VRGCLQAALNQVLAGEADVKLVNALMDRLPRLMAGAATLEARLPLLAKSDDRRSADSPGHPEDARAGHPEGKESQMT